MAPKFFKIVTNPRDHRLRIPSEFMRRHGRNLSDHVSVKAPNGTVSEVRLLRSNGETWLHKGWQEFKQYYSIGFGQLLVFTYDGNSHFDVLIYGIDEMEIEYPCNKTNVGKCINLNGAGVRVPETVDRESESDDSVVFLKECFYVTQQRKKKRPNDLYPRNSNKLNEISVDCPARKPSKGKPKFSSCAKESLRKKATVHDCRDKHVRASRVKPEEYCRDSFGKQSEKRVQSAVSKDTCIAYQKAKSCKFHNPFYISLMQPSYVTGKCILSVRFAKKFLPPKHNELKLQNSEGKTWFVKCIVREDGSKLTGGWKGFVRDNALKVGDACIFEVNKSNPFLWKVTIFHS